MIPGIIAEQEPTPAPGATYSKSAVSFSSAVLQRASLICTDNAYWGFAGWFKTNWTTGFPVAFVVDPNGNYNNVLNGGPLTFTVERPSHSVYRQPTAPSSGAWHHFLVAADVNHPNGSKVIAWYIDDTLQTGSLFDGTTAFTNLANGLPFWVGSDSTSFDYYTGSMSDLSIWAGVDLMQGSSTISSTVRRKFTTASAAASVDPTAPGGLIATFGHPPVFLTGGASSFASNALGTSGAFTIAHGSLSTDLSPPP